MSDTEEVFVPRRFPTKAPFPWYGGKSDAALLIWERLGDVDHYAEPFAGTRAVLLNRPHPCNRPYHSETVNLWFSPHCLQEADMSHWMK